VATSGDTSNPVSVRVNRVSKVRFRVRVSDSVSFSVLCDNRLYNTQTSAICIAMFWQN